MKMLRQIRSVTAMNFRSMPHRLGTSLVIVIGIAGVVAVLVSVLAMATGMMQTIERSGRDDRAIIMRNGSTTEMQSAITRDSVRLIMEGEGIKRDPEGAPIASAEGLRLVNLFRKEDNAEVFVAFRGVGPKVLDVRPEIQIIEGRMFNPAVNEIIVGKAAHAQFKSMNVGDQISTRGATWTVVGVYSSGGDANESQIMADYDTMLSSEQRNDFQSVHVVLESPAAFERLKNSLTTNPALAVDVLRERDYQAQQSETISQFIKIVAYIVGGIMAVGAVFSALNTMYSAVSARVREIATLRALGFGSTAMVISVLAEALLLALIGSLIGSALAWLFFNGNTVSTSATGGVGTHLVFELAVNRDLVMTGVFWACAIGLVGGLFPAVRAARLPVSDALRAV
jgi:putative ABC transport system permease protein